MCSNVCGENTSAEEERKCLQLDSNKTLKVNKGAAKICKDFFKGKNNNFEEFDFLKI